MHCQCVGECGRHHRREPWHEGDAPGNACGAPDTEIIRRHVDHPAVWASASMLSEARADYGPAEMVALTLDVHGVLRCHACEAAMHEREAA